MKVCAISYKDCWQDENDVWYSYGGFPIQMNGINSLFEEMTLIVTRGKQQQGGIPFDKNINVEIIELPKGRGFKRKINVVSNIFYYIKALSLHIKKADVTHTPLPGDVPLIGMVLAIWYKKKIIARYGGSWPKTKQTTFMNVVTKKLIRFFANDKNVMLVTGEGETPPAKEVKWIFSSGITKKEMMIINPKIDRPVNYPLQFVYIGRLSPEKGLQILFPVLADLNKILPAQQMPHLTIIGSGPMEKTLKNLVESLSLTTHISFAGQLNKIELSRQLMDKDICIQPSLTEGYSKAWIDAMACGIPVISSNVGAATHVIGKNNERGWLFEPSDKVHLFALIKSIVEGENRDWVELRKKCRKFAETRTLDNWISTIGQTCSKKWNVPLINGKLFYGTKTR